MHIVFCHDTYYTRSSEGKVYSYGAFPYSLWENRFLKHFDSICVIGRKKKMSMDESGTLDISSGLHVEHLLLPNINTPIKRITQSRRSFRKIMEKILEADGVIIRGPVEFGMMAAQAARLTGTPYAVELSGCAFDHSWYHGSWIGKLYAPIKYRRAMHMVKHADAVIYVTEKFLQERYPTRGITEYASNVEIDHAPDEVLEQQITRIQQRNSPTTIGLIGNVLSGLKGLSIAIKALGIVNASLPEGKDFIFRILGQSRPGQWQAQINENGLQGKVEFCGSVPGGQAVLEWLDDIALYIQPSFHEGLPRALIEAMSRGCPALASDAGGTAELLDKRFIHPRGDVEKLAQQIQQMLIEEDLEECAKTNFAKARNYSREVLGPRREHFWENFKQIIEKNNQKRS